MYFLMCPCVGALSLIEGKPSLDTFWNLTFSNRIIVRVCEVDHLKIQMNQLMYTQLHKHARIHVYTLESLELR